MSLLNIKNLLKSQADLQEQLDLVGAKLETYYDEFKDWGAYYQGRYFYVKQEDAYMAIRIDSVNENNFHAEVTFVRRAIDSQNQIGTTTINIGRLRKAKEAFFPYTYTLENFDREISEEEFNRLLEDTLNNLNLEF